ncbi:hypothetical protein SAMN02910358_01263 [Lachnospiraceae bacterium XBB1006]|nr:hypothetical protein SAMN02910358_01263 [Lachnospiraceae bacterium XBB1006]
MNKQIIAVIVFICFITVMAGCGAKEYQVKKSYSYEELKKLPTDELYQLLKENALYNIEKDDDDSIIYVIQDKKKEPYVMLLQ